MVSSHLIFACGPTSFLQASLFFSTAAPMFGPSAKQQVTAPGVSMPPSLPFPLRVPY
ncbi:hypothetical protein DPMN_054116 [Dreissena polymorpha]|uniref:Uncharacterized protein n=1 Tax=Dreissena polymorpha TaxID=45954 RepID=A0A9D4HQX8_DREPO|nr:hypothetical protein DPMN_054116 [Dreissena polymorpha]